MGVEHPGGPFAVGRTRELDLAMVQLNKAIFTTGSAVEFARRQDDAFGYAGESANPAEHDQKAVIHPRRAPEIAIDNDDRVCQARDVRHRPRAQHNATIDRRDAVALKIKENALAVDSDAFHFDVGEPE